MAPQSVDSQHHWWTRRIVAAIIAGDAIQPDSRPTSAVLEGRIVDEPLGLPHDDAAAPGAHGDPILGLVRHSSAQNTAPAETAVAVAQPAADRHERGSRVSRRRMESHAQISLPANALRQALLDVLAAPGALRPESALILTDAAIQGELLLDGLRLPFPVALTRCSFDSMVLAKRSLWHSLTLRDCSHLGWDLTQSRVRYDLTMRGGEIEGSVVLASSVVMGSLHLSNLVIHPGRGPALDLDHIVVRHECTIGGGKMAARGEVRARHAQFRSSLTFHKITVRGQRHTAMRLDGCVVMGRLSLQGVTATGAVSLDDCEVHAETVLSDATLTDDGGAALSLRRSMLRAVRMDTATVFRGIIDFTDALTGSLRCDSTSRGSTLGSVEVTAAGWRVGHVGGAPLHDAALWTRWFRQASAARPEQPWMEVSRALQKSHAHAAADQLRAAHDKFRLIQASAAMRRWHMVDVWLFGRGKGPWRLIAALSGVAVLCTVLLMTLSATARHEFSPAALSSVQLVEPLRKFPQCSTPLRASLPDSCFVDDADRFDPVVYGLRAASPWPVVTQPTWKPSSAAAGGLLAGSMEALSGTARLCWWGAIVVALGWLWSQASNSRLWLRWRSAARRTGARRATPK